MGEVDKGAGAQNPVVAANVQVFCPIQEEVWTECSSTCLQERYMGSACDKDTEVSRLLPSCRDCLGCVWVVAFAFRPNACRLACLGYLTDRSIDSIALLND